MSALNLPLVSGPLNPANTVDTVNALQNSLNAYFYGSVAPLNVQFPNVGNGADTTEDVLATYTLPANTMSALAGPRGFRIRAWGTCAANGDNKTMNLYFGANVVSTPTAGTNAKNWFLEATVLRSGVSTQKFLGTGLVDTTAVTPAVANGTNAETAGIIIKCTGQAGTANALDIVCQGFIVEALN